MVDCRSRVSWVVLFATRTSYKYYTATPKQIELAFVREQYFTPVSWSTLEVAAREVHSSSSIFHHYERLFGGAPSIDSCTVQAASSHDLPTYRRGMARIEFSGSVNSNVSNLAFSQVYCCYKHLALNYVNTVALQANCDGYCEICFSYTYQKVA
ncbi:unnamed protein product [Haemonchus placei]|uniref:HTH_48 domain-containing protein n=1 Tax=Haemonchus placei TaxID=6290 RepID=A0A0N4WQA8_HAEPC|nr:unnamed protein product [Haemonchus placei]